MDQRDAARGVFAGRVSVRWAGCIVLALGACDGDAGAEVHLPWAAEPFPEVASVDPAVADLGRLLFYDPILSSDGETACATCHSELWGMSDGLATSIGVGGGRLTGPGRSGGTARCRPRLRRLR